MIEIREAQLRALASGERRQLVRKIAARLREEFPDAAAEPEEELLGGVAEQLERAYGYGLRSEAQAALYITTAWLLGRDFDERFPAARRALRDPSLSAAERQAWLDGWMPFLFLALEEE